MTAAPTTVSPHSARHEHTSASPAGARSASRRTARPRRAALPSLVRVLVGVVLLASGLLAWVAGQWAVSARGWEPGALVQAQGTVVHAVAGQDLVLWVPEDAAGERPACRVSDPVFNQALPVVAASDQVTRTVKGTVHVAAGVFTAGSSQVRVACRGEWAGRTAVAPPPEGPAVLREGRWTVLVAMALGVVGVLLLGKELLGTELTVPVQRGRRTGDGRG